MPQCYCDFDGKYGGAVSGRGAGNPQFPIDHYRAEERDCLYGGTSLFMSTVFLRGACDTLQATAFLGVFKGTSSLICLIQKPAEFFHIRLGTIGPGLKHVRYMNPRWPMKRREGVNDQGHLGRLSHFI